MRSRAQTMEFLRSYRFQLHEARLVSEQLPGAGGGDHPGYPLSWAGGAGSERAESA